MKTRALLKSSNFLKMGNKFICMTKKESKNVGIGSKSKLGVNVKEKAFNGRRIASSAGTGYGNSATPIVPKI